MKPKELISKMLKDGWETKRVQGSHYIMKKGTQTEVIPFHNTDIKIGLLNAILKRTGLI